MIWVLALAGAAFAVEYPRNGYSRDGYGRDGYTRDAYARDAYADREHSVSSFGADSAEIPKPRLGEGLILEDQETPFVEDKDAERDEFLGDLEDFAGKDPIELMLVHEELKQRERIEFNRRVIRIMTVVFTISIFGAFLNVLCIVYNRNFWPTPRLMRRLMRRWLRDSLRGSAFKERIVKGYVVDDEKARLRRRRAPLEEDEEKPASGSFDPREGARSRAEELNAKYWDEEVIARKWKGDEPPLDTVSDVTSVASSS